MPDAVAAAEALRLDAQLRRNARAQRAAARPGLLESLQSLAGIIVVALFIITFTVQPFRIPSESMVPTLLVGDFLLVDKEVWDGPRAPLLAPTEQIHRGDLLVFHYPVDPGLHLVKRVVGLPGERIHMRDGKVFVDGHPLAEPYAIYRPAPSDDFRDDFPRMTSVPAGVDARWWVKMRSLVRDGEITVPPDSYFVLGDNRNDSEDSRYWGFVPRAAVVGKPFLVYFSLRSLDETPSALAAEAQPPRRTGVLAWLQSVARWDRVLRVIH